MNSPERHPVTPAEPTGQRDRAGELAAAWDIVVRHMANTTEPHDARSMAFGAVLDALDRAQAVVDAARALVAYVERNPIEAERYFTFEHKLEVLLVALARAVRALAGEQ